MKPIQELYSDKHEAASDNAACSSDQQTSQIVLKTQGCRIIKGNWEEVGV